MKKKTLVTLNLLTFLINSSNIYSVRANEIPATYTPILASNSFAPPVSPKIGTQLPTLEGGEVIEVQEGNIVPFSGILFTGERANTLRIRVLEADKYKKMSESYNLSLSALQINYETLDKKSRMLEKQNRELAESLDDASTVTFWEKFLYFTLGAGLTVLGGIAVKNVAK